MSKITAPFTERQIEALNTWQRWGATRPFVCPKHLTKPLVAKADGLHCPVEQCGHCQDWAFEFMELAKYCTQENTYDAKVAPPSEYWIHIDAVETHPDWEGGILPFHCPNCGLDFEVDCR